MSVDVSGKYTAIQTNNTNQTLLTLLALYPNLEDLTVSQAGLEQAFTQLNKDQLNEGEAA
jgi:ABC-2 type transport system ATP-binding protein